MRQQIVEIPLNELKHKLQDQVKLGRRIKAVLPQYSQEEAGPLILIGYIAVVKVPKKEPLVH